ncbi:MAG: MFS transporter [Thermodesulfobacteriota bacterium]
MKFEGTKNFTLFFGLFFTVLDQMVMVSIAPFISEELGGARHYTWTFTAYMFATAMFLLPIGRIADRAGTKRMYRYAMFVFIMGSLVCIISRSMGGLIAGRFIQGIGAGCVMPLSVGILIKELPMHKLPKTMGTFAVIYGVAAIFGPIFGYALAIHSWRLIFVFDISFAVAIVVLLWFVSHEQANLKSVDGVDLRGISLLTTCLLMLLMGLSVSRIDIYLSDVGFACLLLFPIFVIAFIRSERTVKNPIVPFDYLHSGRIMRCFGMNFILGYLLYTLVVFAHLAFIGHGTHVGLARLYPIYPIMIAIVVGSYTATRFFVFRRPKGVLGLSFGLCISGILLVLLNVQLKLAAGKLAGLFVAGLGIGFLLPLLFIYQQENIRPKGIVHMVFLVQFSRIIGGIIGTSLTAWVLVIAVLKSLDVDLDYINELLIIMSGTDLVRPGIEDAVDTFLKYYLGTILLVAALGMLLGSRYAQGKYSFAQSRRIAELE